MFFKAEPWVEEGHRSWRWKPAFAFWPTKTLDEGWIIFKPYWRWQQSWGWGFWDDFAYARKEGKRGYAV